MTKRVTGKVCKDHPDLKGERYASNRACVGCSAEWRKRFGKSLASPDVAAQRDELLATLEGLVARAECYGMGSSCDEYQAAKAVIAKIKGAR